jgi:CRISPR-associated protein Cas1
MATLYVTQPGCRIEKEYHRLLVTNPEDDVVLVVPLAKVSEVVVIGSVGFTTQAMVQLLENGIPVSIMSSTGKLLGKLQPAASKNIFLRHAQYRRALDLDFCHKMTRSIVTGKVRNQRTLARRICRGRPAIPASFAQNLDKVLSAIPFAADQDTLRGLEGAAAKNYFQILRKAIPPDWDFSSRSRRPPRSPMNALLSLGYSLLTHNLMTALEIVSLDPYDGFFHADAYGRPALALDLVEEFRSVIVDSVVLSVINKALVSVDDFIYEEERGCFLKPAALRKFIRQYAQRIQTRVKHPLAEQALTYQKIFEVQARQMRKVIEAQETEYQPFVFR